MTRAIALAELVALGTLLVIAVAVSSARGAVLKPCVDRHGGFCPQPPACTTWGPACKH